MISKLKKIEFKKKTSPNLENLKINDKIWG